MSRKVYPMMVEETKRLLSDSDTFVSVNLTGVTATDCSELRKEIRAAGGSLRVVKNTAARKCFEESGRESASSIIDGPTALAWGSDDAILSACRILVGWKSKSKSVELTGGWMHDRTLSQAEVNRLASIPPREQLLGVVVGTFQAPIARLVWTLNGLLSGLAIVLKKIGEGRDSDG